MTSATAHRDDSGRDRTRASYWIAALVLIVFGVVTGFSIGGPFLTVGLAMLVLGRLRSRPLLFWPALLAVISFVITVALVAPWSCQAIGTTTGDTRTVCSSLLGATWSGAGLFNPPPEADDMARHAGALVAAVTAAVTLAALLLWRRVSPPPSIGVRS